ncbi:MAG: hypothetical protein HEQ23_16450 [Tepidisphaera sp.]
MTRSGAVRLLVVVTAPKPRDTMKLQALLLLLLASPAAAQNAPADSRPATTPASPSGGLAADPTNPPPLVSESAKISLYQFQAQPRLWYVGLSGDLTLPGSPANNPVATLDELNLDSPQASLSGSATVRFDRWTVNFSAATASSDRSTVAQRAGQIGSFTFNPGDPIRSSFDLTTAELSGGYSVGTWARTQRADGSWGFVADLALIGGLRVYDVEAGVGATAPTGSRVDEFFIEPIAGARLELNLAKDFSIDVQSTFGYLPADRESFSWDIEVAFAWRIIDNLGFEVGYRNMFIHLETGDDTSRFEWEGGAAGVFAGLQLRF